MNPHPKSARGPRLETERTATDLSSAEAVTRLRNLLEQRPSSSHRFETVERWVGHLDDADLQELIGELGMEEYAGLIGWVRCALYAEWARRDPKVALARAEALPDSGDHRNYAVQQTLFSVLRGWVESDPEAALAANQRLGRRITTVLSEWAITHPAEALKLIEQDRLQSHTRSLACAAMMGDPGIARAVMQAMADHSERERAGVLQDVHGVDSIHERDLFPAPGLPNRLPNFRERYEGLLEAVEAGNFRDSWKRSRLRSLNQNFRHKVPEAQEAYEAMGREG
jgi:hypothetical protein